MLQTKYASASTYEKSTVYIEPSDTVEKRFCGPAVHTPAVSPFQLSVPEAVYPAGS